MNKIKRISLWIFWLAGFAAFGLRPIPVSAAAITVTTTLDVVADDGFCSIREAVIAANSNAAYSNCPAGITGEDEIVFDPALPLPATFTLTVAGKNEDYAASGDLDIRESLIISGAGSGNTIIDGNLNDRVFEIPYDFGKIVLLTVNGVTIQHGNPGSGAEGGGVLVALTERLTLNDSQVTANAATSCASYCGGGIKSYGLLTVNNSSLTANQGGGIHNSGGIADLTNALVSGNTMGYGIANLNKGYLLINSGEISNNQGGGILNKGSTANSLSGLIIRDNSLGGGIHNDGLADKSGIQVTASLVEGNTGLSGAGIFNEGSGATAKIIDSTLRLNVASANGGGINNTGSLTLERSTVNSNQAVAGGGIDHNGSTLSLINATLSQNSASDNGGGLYNRGSATFLNVTVFANSASGPETGGNLYNGGDTASLAVRNTIVAGAGAGGNCVNNLGMLTSLGNNLEDGDLCGFHAAGDLIHSDPLLGPLQNNGGPTYTHLPAAVSPAIDAGSATVCPPLDQRGVARPLGAACDIGSVEAAGSLTSADLSVSLVDSIDPVLVGTNILYTATVANGGPDATVNTVLTIELPAGLQFLSAIAGQGSCYHSGGVVTCSLGSLAYPGQVNVQVTVKAVLFGIASSAASVSSAAADGVLVNNSAIQATTVEPLRLFLPQIQTQ